MLEFSLSASAVSLEKSLGDSISELNSFQRRAIENIAKDMEAELKEVLNTPVENVDGKIIRSSPGEAPRRETGRLKASIGTQVNISGNEVQLIAGDLYGHAPYALYLEYGTLNTAARPYLLPALSKYSGVLEDLYKDLEDYL